MWTRGGQGPGPVPAEWQTVWAYRRRELTKAEAIRRIQQRGQWTRAQAVQWCEDVVSEPDADREADR